MRSLPVGAVCAALRRAAGHLPVMLAAWLAFGSANAEQLTVTSANGPVNQVFNLALTPNSTATGALITGAQTLNSDGGQHGAFDALAWAPNPFTGTVDLIVADSVNQQVLRYAGATPSTGSVLYSASGSSRGPRNPTALAVDSASNIYVLSSGTYGIGRASIWVLPYRAATGTYGAPVLVDQSFGGVRTRVFADAQVATAPTALWNAGDLLVLVADGENARVIAYSKQALAALLASPGTPLGAPTSTLIAAGGFDSSGAVPSGMAVWPSDGSLLFTSGDGRILRYNTSTRPGAFMAPFSSLRTSGYLKIRTGSFANTPYAFVTQVSSTAGNRILQFGAPTRRTPNVPLASVATGVNSPIGIAVSSADSAPASDCLATNGGCDIQSTLLMSSISVPPGVPVPPISGNVLSETCTVQNDPRVTFPAGGAWACNGADLDLSTLCPGFPRTLVPGTMCGHSGASGRGFVAIKSTASGIDPYLNDTYVLTSTNIGALLPGPQNLSCPQVPIVAWSPRPDLPGNEGTIAEQATNPYLIDLTGFCDSSATHSRGLSMYALGLQLNTAPSGMGAGGLPGFVDAKFANAQATIASAAITSGVQAGLQSCTTQAQSYFDQGIAGNPNGLSCAAYQVAACESQLMTALSNSPANFSSNLTSTGGNPNPFGDLDGRFANLFLAINTVVAGNPTNTSWPATNVPSCVSLTATPATVAAGSAATLSWSAAGVPSGQLCTLQGPTGTPLATPVSVPATGSGVSTGALATAGSYLFQLDCPGSGGTSGLATATVTVPPTGVLVSQSITFGAIPALSVGTSGVLSATASSGLAVTFASLTPATCSVTGTTANGVASGTCTIAASQGGNATYAPATTVTANATVAATLIAQTISFGAAPVVNVGTSGTVTATATSGLPVALTSATPAVCTVAGSTITGVASGSCVINANQSGDAAYAPAPQATLNITVGGALAGQSISFGAAPSIVVAATGTVGATATSGLPVAFSSLTTSVCTVAGTTVTGVTGGTCTIAANQPGDGVNFGPAPQVTQSFPVGLASQTITFGLAPTVTVGGTGTLSATASSGLPVSYSSLTTAVCTVAGTTVSGVAVGTCTVAADQPGNGVTYLAAAQVTQTFAVTQAVAPALVIDTFAGRGAYTGAVPVALANIKPWALTIAPSGTVYFAERTEVYRIDAGGTTITSVAGTGTFGYSGDGGPATSAQLGVISSLAVDATGNLYLADYPNHVVRKVTPAGIISTFAGNGTNGTTGDGGPAAAASLFCPYYLHVDASNNLLIADCGDAIRSVNLATGTISTVPGSANTFPASVTSDAAGNVYYIYSSSGGASTPDVLYKLPAGGGAAVTLATLQGACSEGLAIDAGGNLYTPDYCTENLYQITPTGTVSIIAGSGGGGFSPDGTLASSARLGDPADVAVDATGTIYFTDNSNYRVRKFALGGTLATVAGTDNGLGAPATAAAFMESEFDISTDPAGTLYWAAELRRISSAGILSNYAGQGFPGFGGDGGPVSAALFSSWAIAFDSASNGFVADYGNNRIRKVTSAGIVNTIAGNGTWTNTGDGGAASAATVAGPQFITVDAAGNIYFTVRGGNAGVSAIRRISTSGIITQYAGQYTASGYAGDGGPATAALFANIAALVTDAAGNLYVADSDNNVIRRIDTSGVVTTVVGTGSAGFSGDGGLAAQAQLFFPRGLAMDAAGNLYIGDTGSNRVRIVTPAGIISTYAGSGAIGLSGDGGAPLAAAMEAPTSVALDGAGTLYIHDSLNHRIRRVWKPGATAQTTTFGAAPSVLVGGSATLSATSSSGLAVRYVSLTPSVCTVVGTTVVALTTGTCTIAATNDGNATYASAPQVTQSFAVAAGSTAQTVTFGALPGIATGTSGALAASASSGLPVTFASTTPAVCAVIGSTVSGLAVGSCGVTASQAGSATYAPASASASLPVAAGLALQAIAFATPASPAVGTSVPLSATATSGLPVTFSSTTPSFCTVTGNTLTGVQTGICTIAANQAGNGTFAPAPQVTATVTVGIGSQTITFGAAPTVVLGGTGTLVATATSGLPVTFTALTPALCTVTGTTVTGVAVGTCTVAADQSGGPTSYTPAPQVTQTFPVTQVAAPARIIDTFAGRGPYTAPIPAASANINPYTIAVASSGVVYFGDSSEVLRYDPSSGAVVSVAGTGTTGYSGDGGLATSAQLGGVSGLALDATGNLYIGDYGNNVVRRVTPAGVISTFAGTGAVASTGDGGPASAAALNGPCYVHVDAGNNLLIAECGNGIRAVNLATGIISTIAGTAAMLPVDVTSNAAGDLYYTVAAVPPTTPNDVIFKLPAGSGSPVAFATLPAIDCSGSLSIDAGGNLYAPDPCDHNLYEVSPAGVVSLIAGNGTPGASPDGTPAALAQLGWPSDVGIDGTGRIYFADESDFRIRAFQPGGVLATVAGTNNGSGGPATAAVFEFTGSQISTDSSGNVYYARLMRKITPTGIVTDLAGPFPGFSGDGGPLSAASFDARGVVFDTAGNGYVADSLNNRVRKVTAAGIVSTIAGDGNCANTGDGGPSSAAEVGVPRFIALDSSGNLYFAVRCGGAQYSAIRRISPAGIISLYAGNYNARGYSGDGGPATAALFADISGIATDAAGNLYVAESGNNIIRRIDTTGIVSTIAGTTIAGNSGDGGLATAAQLSAPGGVAVDSLGNVYIADLGNNRIRMVSTTSVISAYAGTGVVGFSGDGGSPLAATLQAPTSLASSGGTLYIYDSLNNRIRRVWTPGATAQTISFGAAPSVLVGGSATLSATSSSGLAVRYASLTPSVCTVVGTTVVALTTGTCTVAATNDGNATYASAPQATQSFAVAAGSTAQTITFGALPGIATGTSGTLVASASSGLPVTFASTTPAVCAVAGSTVSGLTVGSCGITASQAGSATYAPASAGASFPVAAGLTLQTIAFTAPGSLAVGASMPLSATATSGLPVTFSSTTPGSCTVSGSTATGVQAGTCTIAANQAGNGTFAPAPQVTATVTVGISSQTITFGAAPTVVLGGTGTLTASASSSLPVTFTSLTSAVCTVTGTTVTGVAVGTCTVAADQPGSASQYTPAPQVTQAFPVIQAAAPARIIDTFAGRGPYTAPVPAASANIQPWPIALAPSGAVYFAERSAVLRYDPSSRTVVTVAGSDIAGYSGDGGPATAAQISVITSLALDATGNLYIVDYANNVVRKVTPAGIISTLAGTGIIGSSGDGGPANAAALNCPYYAHVDAGNNLLIAECGDAIRSVNLSTGTISTVPGTITTFPSAVTSDATGNIYYIVSSYGAPNATPDILYKLPTGSGAPIALATLQGKCSEGLAIDVGGNLYTADYCTESIYRITPTGTVSIIAGSGGGGFSPDGTLATAAHLGDPADVAVDASGTVYFTDDSNYRVRAIQPDGTLTTLAGTDNGEGRAATTAVFEGTGISADAAGNVYWGGELRRVSPDGIVTNYAGRGFPGFSGDGGPVSAALFAGAESIAFDSGGNGYVADIFNNRIRKVTAAGIVSTIGGNSTFGNTGDGGPATAATIGAPAHIVADAAGNVYFQVSNSSAFGGGSAIRRISASGVISLYAGSYTANGYSGDGGAATAALFNHINAVAIDSAGNLYVADTGNNVIRRITPSGIVTTVAGNGIAGSIGDGGAATAAELNAPQGVTVDGSGNLYIADSGNHRIRVVSTGGIISSFAGTGAPGLLGDGGLATASALHSPGSLALDGSGTLYVNDTANHRIRRIWMPGAAAQTITLGALPIIDVGGSSTLIATASSGLAVTFTSTTPGTCAVFGDAVTGVAGGTCTVAANQYGNFAFAAAPTATLSFPVSGAPLFGQFLSFGPAPVMSLSSAPSGAISLAAIGVFVPDFTTSTLDPRLTVTSTDPQITVATGGGVATVSMPAEAAPLVGQTLIATNFTVSGDFTVQVQVDFTNATVQNLAVVNVNIGSTIIAAEAGYRTGGSGFAQGQFYVSGASQGALGTSIGSPAIFSFNRTGNTLSEYVGAVGSATPTLLATYTDPSASGLATFYMGLNNYSGSAAAASVQFSNLVGIAPTGSNSTVVFTSLTPSVCSVGGSTLLGGPLRGGTVTAISTGTCTIAADIAGSGTFSAAPQAVLSFTISP